VKQKHPIALWRRGPHFPAAQLDAIRRANAKVFLRCAGHCQHACSLLDSIRIQVHRVKNARSNEMAENCGGDWDEDQ
jgi:hypothetical protein